MLDAISIILILIFIAVIILGCVYFYRIKRRPRYSADVELDDVRTKSGSATSSDSAMSTPSNSESDDSYGIPLDNIESSETWDGGVQIGADPVCAATDELVDKFLSDRFTAELAEKMEALAADIAYDISEIKSKKPANKNTLTAKVLLDSMLHYYIYTKAPNNLSKSAIKDDIAFLDHATDSYFAAAKVAKVIDILKTTFVSDKDDAKLEYASSRECFRRERVLSLASSGSNGQVDALKEELSRKNIELRAKADELERMQKRTTTSLTGPISSLTSSLMLEECNRERRLLQEKVYDLKREIESVRISGIGSDGPALRSRVEELRRNNERLEQQLRDAQRAHSTEATQINQLSTELHNCKQLLDQVLSANG